MKTTISEIKNIPEEINSKLDEAENEISDLEDKSKHQGGASKREENFI